MWRDIAYGFRVFRGQPGVFALTIAGLGITIALCTAMFSVVNAVAFGTFGARDPSMLRRFACGGFFSEPPTGSLQQWQCGHSDYRALAASLPSVTLTASAVESVALSGSGSLADRAAVAAVSGNYFSVLGVRADRGRILELQDDVPGAPPAAVISYGLWRNRLGGDRQIVGKPFRVGGHAFTVVGVLERGFDGSTGGSLPPGVWIPLSRSRDVWGPDQPGAGWNPAVYVIGRVTPGAGDGAVEAQVSARLRTRLTDHGQALPPGATPVRIQPLQRSPTTIVVGAVLMAVVGLLVLLACANVANVLLANAVTRAREIATRRALGASRARVARQLLTESLLLGASAGALGYVLATWLVPLLATSLRIPATADVSPDLSVYAFVVVLIVVVGTSVGLAPAAFSRRDDLLLSTSNGLVARGPLTVRRLRSLLLGAQAAISVVLLVAAALLARSLLHLATLDIGYDVDRLSVASVSVGPQADDRSRAAFWRDAADRVRQRPGVSQAALVGIPPFAPASLPRLPDGIAVHRIEASSEYFETLGLKFVRGRGFTRDEVASELPVAVIDETLARQYWSGQNPVGSTLERVWGTVPAPGDWPDRRADTRVVGVVAHGITQFAHAEAPTIVLPIRGTASPRLLVRSSSDPSEGLARQIREAVREANVDTDAVVTYLRDEAQREMAPLRMLAACGAIIGLGSLLLAAMGVSGVAAFLVARRRREIAIRLSVGATHGAIVRALLRETLTTVAMGAGLGLTLALPAAGVLRHVLFGLSPRDPGAMVAAVALVLGAAVVAVLVPARRAVKVDAMQALKTE